MKILEEAGMENHNLVHTQMNSRLKLSKSEEEREVDANGSWKISDALDNYFIQDQIFLITLECWVDIFRVWESLLELQWNNAYGICKVLLLSAYRLDALVQRYRNLLTTVIVAIMLIMMMVRVWLDTFSTSVKVQLLGVHKSKRHLRYHRVRQVGTKSARQVIWLQNLLSEVTGIACEKVVIRKLWCMCLVRCSHAIARPLNEW